MKRKIVVLVLFIILLMDIFIISLKKEISFIGKNIEEVRNYALQNNFELEIIEEYNNDVEKDIVYMELFKDNKIIAYVSLGQLDEDAYIKYKVNELGEVPIMMYHGIQNIDNNNYIGGNIDKEGYQRTAKAFRDDLEFYYQNGYRIIKLSEYIVGNIDVELGKSPLILTFDDGLENNVKVLGIDETGEIIIDSNSAVGILEEYKNKYPDYNVTATFFINAGLFNQGEYDKKIIRWLVNNGYSIGNHSYSHVDFSKIDDDKTQEEIGKMYQLLDTIIPNQYESIVALPFGSPYTTTNSNFNLILDGIYNGFEYETISTLRVGWKSEYSPFHKDFDSKFLKRIRAYDNNGKNFDIEMNFDLLNNTKYISDGNINTIVIPECDKSNIGTNMDKKVIVY